MNAIDKFEGEYRFLSNFYPSPVTLDWATYRSVEHAFQAAKTISIEQRDAIRAALTAKEAKRLGRKVQLREDWEEIKVETMAYLVWNKFSLHPELAERLLNTGNRELIEGNWWGDTFWGMCQGTGHNNLGKILMRVRTDLRGVR
jgi:ribA/ribD-fused uncharacterized protein